MLLKHQIMIKEDGLDHNVIKIKPPLCFTKENADTLIKALENVIKELGKWKKTRIFSLSDRQYQYLSIIAYYSGIWINDDSDLFIHSLAEIIIIIIIIIDNTYVD